MRALASVAFIIVAIGVAILAQISCKGVFESGIEYELKVEKVGTGNGAISSSDGKINNCSGTCATRYKSAAEVILTAQPTGRSVFIKWAGAVESTSPSITVKVNGNKTLQAYFRDNSRSIRTLTVVKTGSGNGNVTSSPAGINCGSNCSAEFEDGLTVTLTAVTDGKSVFEGWSGDANATSAALPVLMNGSKTIYARFRNASTPKYTLTITKTGAGTVTSNPAGINCGSTCSAAFEQGTSVTLTASPGSGYQFSSWGGAGSGSSPTLTIKMDGNKTVSANFTELPPLVFDQFDVSPTANGWVYGPRNANGAAYRLSGGFLQVASFGSGSEWHGPDLIKTLSQTIDVNNEDFGIDVFMVANCNSVGKWGLIWVGLTDALNSDILSAYWFTQPGWLGDSRNLVLKTPDGNDHGSNYLGSVGGKITLKKQSGILSLHYNDGDALVSKTITTTRIAAKLFVRIWTYGAEPTCESMKIDWIQVKKM
ncbi:MAG: hypothetical protein ONB44_07730 [candidate division KSB1 bacterium]|nr:hypothetical protein [candidate division KSB1 bacterium]MDZ7302016.1 hypothetical protein [candidate division KSB1 bacterium]MDZ7310198.1 hypothetical protein [candidate division KSB1 bacterium]